MAFNLRRDVLDAEIRQIAQRCDWKFETHKMDAPIGSEFWHSYCGDVLTVAHNTGRITMDKRNELLQELYQVWNKIGAE